ncbi:nitrate reductase [Hyphococcus luteus]|uniref:nitrate reductase n=1 Tax=Hyphococcus luteus TaxID=2058213 RepID=UPI001A9C3E1D|nr:nitrate reductase [Marinicaulis flavus]
MALDATYAATPGDVTRTTCPYCGVGCGVLVKKTADAVSVEGDPDHPANFGRLCSKGLALVDTLGRDNRLLYPLIKDERVSWDRATDVIADKFRSIIAEHGPDAVAFYVSGQILTEDYYVANKLMKGFIGSANIDTNSRLCMASSVTGHKRAFGADSVPGCYEDLELADLIVLTGSNLAWCHPVLYQRILAAKEKRPGLKIVVIDPRKTATCEFADLHLAIAPDSDVALFQGLLNYLDKRGGRNDIFIRNHTNGADTALNAAKTHTLGCVADETELHEGDIIAFYELFLSTRKTVTVYSQGVNQAADGSDRVNAIINCHLLTGRIGEPGMGPFSVTGQPNAMGGREVGGLANQLASHMELGDPVHRDLVQRFWTAPRMAEKPGLKAVDLFEAIHAGKVKAVWIMATNPVASMPNADRVREALKKCELVVVSDVNANTDTAACADILLPSASWGEKNGTVTNSERRISRQRRFLKAPGEARDDWRQFCDVAVKMGWGEAFSYEAAADIFREYASLCAFENDGARDLNLSALKDIDAQGYDALAPVQWPVSENIVKGKARLFADGRFFTQNGKASFIVPAASPDKQTTPDFPFVLNTGRIRDHWHTMTRTGRSARLSQHFAEPFIEISPRDAERLRIKDADIVRVSSLYGLALTRALVTDRQRDGSVFAPMHWTEEFSSKGRIDALVAAVTDPLSGQPALKSGAARIERFDAAWHGFGVLATRDFSGAVMPAGADYWAKARIEGGLRAELASAMDYKNIRFAADAFFEPVLERHATEAQVIQYCDRRRGVHRFAVFIGDRLKGAFFMAKTPVEISRSWACELLGRSFAPQERVAVLAGRPGDDAPDRGAIVCTCMNVGANEIAGAVAKGCTSLAKIGAATGAGTNCGSCRGEIKRLLPETADAQT